MICFLAQFSETPCDGQLVRCHLLPRRELKKLWKLVHESTYATAEQVAALEPFLTFRDLSEDERTWVPGCGGPVGLSGHHGELDHSRTLRVPRDRLPAGVEEIARELGFVWYLDREFGLAGERAAA